MWNGSCSRFNADSQSVSVAAGPMRNGSGSSRAVGIRTGYRKTKAFTTYSSLAISNSCSGDSTSSVDSQSELLAAGPVWIGSNCSRFDVDCQSRFVAAGPMWNGSCSRFNVDSQSELMAAGPMWNGSGSSRRYSNWIPRTRAFTTYSSLTMLTSCSGDVR